jgi:DNA-directed RNA polymerase subunit alpha
MEISPTEYLKPKIVDVDIKSPNRAKVTLEPYGKRFWTYIRKRS